jgi:choline kinase
MTKRVVFIAAGMGRRLAPYTDEMPKCLVPVRGKPMLVWALDALRAHGVDDIVIIRGYKAEVLEARKAELGPGVRFVENPAFRENNILQSLFHAREHLEGDLYLTYSDILFAPDVVGALAASPHDFSLIVDREYAKIYEGRSEHPLPEAEVCTADAQGRIGVVGKRSCAPEVAHGEFIGLARLTAAATRKLVATYDALAAEHEGQPTAPFGRNTWRGAYLTDLFEALIARGEAFHAVDIRGRWREIDTTQDLAAAEARFPW